MADPILIEDEAETGPIGNRQLALASIDSVSRSIWSRLAAVKPLGGSCGNSSQAQFGVEAARCRLARRPMPLPQVWGAISRCGRFGHRGYLAQLEHAFGEQRIGLQDVEAAAVDQQLEFVQAVIVLAAGDLDPIEPVAQPGKSSVVVSGSGSSSQITSSCSSSRATAKVR